VYSTSNLLKVVHSMIIVVFLLCVFNFPAFINNALADDSLDEYLNTELDKFTKDIEKWKQQTYTQNDIQLAANHLNASAKSYSEGEVDKALDYAKKAIESCPLAGLPYIRLGWLYIAKGDYKKSLLSFKKFRVISPDDQRIFFGIASAYFELGEIDNANKANIRYLKAQPQNKEAQELQNEINNKLKQ